MAKLCFSLLLLLQLQLCMQLIDSRSTAKFLPGFQGPLPFELETGYVGVGESEDAQLFYYFVKSEKNPKEDPLLLWLTGGPGCSAFSALVYEIGPINFNILEYNGSLPTLHLNPYSWTKEASILFVDSPVGTGFSYVRTPLASQTGDFKQVHQVDQFLRKWLMDHPEFLSNPFYVGGDSYSGITVPPLVQQISNENEEGIKPLINLQGYILGNPKTDKIVDKNSQIPFAHGMGLISNELYEFGVSLFQITFLQSLKITCGGDYANIDPSNVDCLNDNQAFSELISGLDQNHILEPRCPFFSPKPRDSNGKRRSLNDNEKSQEFLDPEPALPSIGCRSFGYMLSQNWENDYNVRKALQIRQGSKGKWQRCNYDLPYTEEIGSSFSYHVSLSTKGYRSLIYSGDHDMVVPFLGTEAWIKTLNYSIIDDWRPWILHSQVAGFTRTYSNRMTYASVKGGGHIAPEYRPAECYAMFQRWINHDPL
ncbi:serine carboxypeptidase-like 17 isoform X2 [Citrus clementina]|uniref:serine carboxypeptidase-like 17 isoform X2 n=1 Tax=Citrus clementina TaxID=85681 RepID=UPI000CECF835|nr:serine carboxypeptidase-like 17 isoform X2 [Citrus x clementina]